MGRHEAELPARRRMLAAGLGVTTVLILATAIWQLGQRSGAEAVQATTTAPPPTPTTTAPPPTPTTIASTTAVSSTPATVTTATAPSSTRRPPTSTATTLAPLSLEPDGLGPVRFGAAPEEAIAVVADRLGSATSDSGWVSARGTFGTCPGSIVRVVRWQSLRLYFSDGPTAFGEDTAHFFFYAQSSAEADVVLSIRTESGIGIGSTVAELTDAYGERVTIESSSPFGVTFSVSSAGAGLLSGTLTQSVPEGQVTSVAGGFGCGG